jgi:hypothetical protein
MRGSSRSEREPTRAALAYLGERFIAERLPLRQRSHAFVAVHNGAGTTYIRPVTNEVNPPLRWAKQDESHDTEYQQAV